MSLRDKRQIMTKSLVGKQHIKEVLSGMLMGEILHPRELWLVSAWISDFELIDNRGGAWDLLNPSWGHRMVTFFEMLETAVSNGCHLNVVVKKHSNNLKPVAQLQKRLGRFAHFRLEETEELHTKGLLTKHAFLGGSMNFTYSGTNRNEEMMIFERDPNVLANTGLEFSTSYLRRSAARLFARTEVAASSASIHSAPSASTPFTLEPTTTKSVTSTQPELSQPTQEEDDDDCLF
ncbi:phospholipase D-like domain-containing protein [Vibrio brasiliensis]|uniref:phospholipase D-like domain-containing protein DpdK n=1 Tax=Vibrio brasiliensis TaxID=170652 RepID=UPI001EFDF300|nr:phospholipase D-like domain-containing protein DpdK [Vibrio brasiliensis]MCG9751350.1 phospholipase D-like domain-containing protein [Vibrio brasiliensis]